jgi:hypothetical protein
MPGKGLPLIRTHPAIAADWHPTANGSMTPADVSAGSKFEAVWLCHGEPQHEVMQRVDYRVAGGGCRICLGAQSLAQNNLLLKFPDVASQWHPTKNGELIPNNIAPMSNKKVWWQCGQNPGHAWQAAVSNRTAAQSGCPFCASVIVDDSNSLAGRYPDVASQWHPTKNGDLTAKQVTYASNKKVWWRCPDGHAWQAEISDRTVGNNGCPHCINYYLTDKDRLSERFPEIAAQWHPSKNRRLWPQVLQTGNAPTYNKRLSPKEREHGSRRFLLPSDVFAGSNEVAWWQCPVSPEHEWKASVSSRTKDKEGCPFCAGLKVCSDNNLAVLYPALSKQWHSKNNRSFLPSQVTPSSTKLAWWRCFKNPNHTWENEIKSVVAAYDSGSSACPTCQDVRAEARRKAAEEADRSTL